MMMRDGERWICSNPKCRYEVHILMDESRDGTGPKCSCGSGMKKSYTAPKVSTIDMNHTLTSVKP